MKKYTKTELFALSPKERKKIYKELLPIANRRIDRINELDMRKQSMLKTLNKHGYFGKNYTKENYNKLVRFMAAQTSTIQGINRATRNRTAALRKLGVSDELLHNDDFFTFLHSQEYKSLKMRNPSSEIIEEYELLFEQGKTVEEIESEFRSYAIHDKPLGRDL